jgi:DNA-binding MarR family transcriptional regulator
MTMRIDAFLRESPMFAILHAARRLDTLANEALAEDDLSFAEGLILTAILFEEPRPIKPSQLADTFGTTRGNISHSLSSLEAKGFLQRRIDPVDARAYQVTLRPSGKRCALRVVGTFDRLQRMFEREIGKTTLKETLTAIRAIESLAIPIRN